MIKNLTGWRGLMAVYVVLFHYSPGTFAHGGSLGVCFFFVVSGFLTAFKHDGQVPTLTDTLRHLWRKVAQVVPLHWLALAVLLSFGVFFGHESIDWKKLLIHIFLLQSWVPHSEYYFVFNSVSWFLGNLLFYYLCWPVLARWFCRLRLRWQVAIVALWWMIDLATHDPAIRILTYVSPLTRLGDFVLGVATATVARRLPRSPSGSDVVEWGAVVLGVASMMLASYTRLGRYDDYLLWWPCVAAGILAFYWTDSHPGVLGRLMHSAPMQWLGKVSLEIYLLQHVAAFIVNYLVAPVFGHFGVMIYHLNAWFALPLLLVMAWGIYPLRVALARRLTRPKIALQS